MEMVLLYYLMPWLDISVEVHVFHPIDSKHRGKEAQKDGEMTHYRSIS